MKDFWKERYPDKDYTYGQAPNEYFKEQIDEIQPGKILLPVEGEGRNAVYAARRQWEVSALDFPSFFGRKKGKLAKEI